MPARYEDDGHRRLGDLDRKASILVGGSFTLLVLSAGAYRKAAGNEALLHLSCVWWIAMSILTLSVVLIVLAASMRLASLRPTDVRYVTDDALGELTTPKAMGEPQFHTAGRIAVTALANGRAAHDVATRKARRVTVGAILLAIAATAAPLVGILVAISEWMNR